MAAQKLVALGELVLPEGDIFEVTDKARGARTVLEQAEKEIRKSFPDFKITFSVASVRNPPAEGAGKPGRKSAAEIAAAAAAQNGGAGAGAAPAA